MPYQAIGLVHLTSPYSVAETALRLEAGVVSRGLSIFARIHHSEEAVRVGLQMNPTTLLLFGSARAGTPLMLAAPTIAIDLPLKALVWQDEAGRVWLSYNDPEYILAKHSAPHELLQNIAGLKQICEGAVQA